MTRASDNVYPRLLISEGGSTATPAADRVTIYAKSNGLLYSKDDAGAETALGAGGGSVATDAIWDAAGDLAVGSGANTAAKLTKGSDNDVLTISASTHVPVWAAPAVAAGRPSAYGDAVMALKPLAYYPMQEASGLLIEDVSGFGRHGTYKSSGVSYAAAGPVEDEDHAITFDGANGYAVVPVFERGRIHMAWSVALWFKTSAVDRNEAVGGRSTALPSVTVGATAAGGGAGKPAWWIDSSGIDYGIYSNATYNDGNWHLFVGTLLAEYNVALVHADMALYIDGSAVATSNNSTGTVTMPLRQETDKAFNVIGAAQDFGNKFDGSIAHVAFFPTKVSSSQVTSLWDARDD
jgi:hypothetical protein